MNLCSPYSPSLSYLENTEIDSPILMSLENGRHLIILESLFPLQSQCFLPREYRNRFTHSDELREW